MNTAKLHRYKKLIRMDENTSRTVGKLSVDFGVLALYNQSFINLLESLLNPVNVPVKGSEEYTDETGYVYYEKWQNDAYKRRGLDDHG
jgi:hypothetical protein